ncbi:hypothetical protein DB347_20915 [Opitutaceae bacterium EW11]|nr:hypothetical protein DB347_20915 [Opitutaceae bacterium EW11]
MSDSFLSHRRITRALRRLSELAANERLALEIALCHGHIMTVVYTLPDDASGHAKMVVSSSRGAELVRQVASEQRLPSAWIEEDVKFFVALTAARNPSQLREYAPSLILSVSEPPHLFAMKLHALHADSSPALADRHDLAFLLQKLSLSSMEAVEHAYARFFPDQALPDDVRKIVAQLLPASNAPFAAPVR